MKIHWKDAWEVLVGRKFAGDRCHEPHVLPNHTMVNDDRLKGLEEATDELKFALGFIAHVETKQYGESVSKVIGKGKN